MKGYILNCLRTLQLVWVSLLFAVIAGVFCFVQQIAMEKVTWHFLTEKPSVSHIFIDPDASAGSVTALESFILSLPQVSDVSKTNPEEGARYLQKILNNKTNIDARGIPVRLEVLFDRAIGTADRDLFEKRLSDFNLVDVVTFDLINKQSGLWPLILSMLLIGFSAIFMLIFLVTQRKSDLLFVAPDIHLELELGIKYFALKRWLPSVCLIVLFCAGSVGCFQWLFQTFIMNELSVVRLFSIFLAVGFLISTWGWQYRMLDKKLKKVYSK